jgi:hypothetical protein
LAISKPIPEWWRSIEIRDKRSEIREQEAESREQRAGRKEQDQRK